MASSKRFAVFDGDSHVLEPRDIWEKYLDPEFRTLGKFALWREESEFGSYTVVNGKPVRDVTNNNIPRNAIWRPGMTWEEIGDLDPDVAHPINEGSQNPRVRLQDMDAMGVDQALLFPTIYKGGLGGFCPLSADGSDSRSKRNCSMTGLASSF